MDAIKYNDLWFHLEGNNYKLYFTLRVGKDPYSLKVWECFLCSLWKNEYVRETPELKRIWEMHVEGDYYQWSLDRCNYELHPHVSYTSWFHDMIRINRNLFPFINNIYSTSKLSWLMNYPVKPDSINFWKKQVDKGLAIYIEEEQRFKALI